MKLAAAAAFAAALTMIGSAPAFAASGQDAVDAAGHRVAQTGRAVGHAGAGLGRSVGHAVAQTGRDATGNGPSHRRMHRRHHMRHHHG